MPSCEDGNKIKIPFLKYEYKTTGLKIRPPPDLGMLCSQAGGASSSFKEAMTRRSFMAINVLTMGKTVGENFGAT